MDLESREKTRLESREKKRESTIRKQEEEFDWNSDEKSRLKVMVESWESYPFI